MTFEIKINDISQEIVEHYKFLCIIIDDNLYLRVNQVILKITKLVYLVSGLSKYLSKN